MWRRFANSRFVGGTDRFGNGHAWRHSYQWELVSAGTGKLDLYEPNGYLWRFTNVATNEWRTDASAGQRIFQSGNNYVLQRRNGWQYRFEKLGSGSAAYYQLQDFKDSQDNLYTLTYDANKRLTRVTEPAGRYLEIFYTQLPVTRVATGLLGKPANVVQGQWNELTVTNTNQYRYVRYTACSWCHASVAEIELVNAATNVVTGTAFGALPAFAAGQEPDKVNDGDTGTFYKYKYPQWGFVGVDFGDGNEQQISKIRFFPSGTMAYSQFEGMNELPELITVISEVRTSDGRSVTYEYEEFDDPSLPVTYQMLKAAQYGDGTRAEYALEQTYAGTRPLLTEVVEPRYRGQAVKLRYEYNLNTKLYGTVLSEKNGVTGETIVSVSRSSATSTADYANGKRVTRQHFTTGPGKVKSRTDGLNRKTEYTYTENDQGFINLMKDPLNRNTTFDRTFHGNYLTNSLPDGAQRIWSRDGRERVLTFTDELGRTTTYTRDGQGRVTRVDYPDTSFETFDYNAFSQVLTNRLRNGGTIINTYDARGLLLSRRDPEQNETHFTYDSADRLASVTDARNNTTQYAYNERGLVTKITHPDSTFVEFAYDSFGNRTSVVNELGKSWAYTFDEFNRVKTITDPLLRVTQYEYGVPGAGGCAGCSGVFQSFPIKITDPKLTVTEFDYDKEWQLKSIKDPEQHVTSWTYDAAGNRKTQTDARGNTYTWNYDDRNRVISEVNALSQSMTYDYDAVSNLISRLDAAGVQTAWTYDSMNRVTSTGSGTLVYEYDYDLGGRRIEMRMVEGVNRETTTYSYDLRDLLLSKVDPSGFHLNYGYDDVGNRVRFTMGSVLSQTYDYDSRNRVTNITANAKSTSFSYDATSRRTAAVWPNNSTASYVYDDANQVLSIVHQRGIGLPIASFAYEYDLAGNRTSMTTLEGVNSYAYNANNWLTSAAYPDGHSQAFMYDPVGNRTGLAETFGGSSSRETASVFDAANRILSSLTVDSGLGTTNSVSYAFDAAGRLTGQTVDNQPRTYAYDFRSQMTSLTDTNSVTFSYAFDGDGNRIREVGTAVPAVRYVYDGPNVVLEIESGVVKAAYVNGLGIDQPIERIEFLSGLPANRHVYHTDALGSVWVMTDDLQVVSKSYSYEAFGKLRTETGTGLLIPNRYTYTAREALGDSLGLYYYRWRVMDPRAGRFTSEDPLRFAGGLHLFRYVGNGPVNRIDPVGLRNPLCDELLREIEFLKSMLRMGDASGLHMPAAARLLGLRIFEAESLGCFDGDDDDNCPEPPPVVVPPVKEPALSPRLVDAGKTAGKVAVGVGAGYLIYRGIRLLPSLFPPLWPTLPANAAIP